KIRREANDLAGANADRAEGLKRLPTDAVSWNTRGVWRMNDDPIGALRDFDEALQMDPRFREALQNKALVLADMLNRPRGAVAVLDKLLELYPSHVEARAGRGVYLARIGEIVRAKKDAADCRREEQTPILLYQLACLYAQLSRHGDADGN